MSDLAGIAELPDRRALTAVPGTSLIAMMSPTVAIYRDCDNRRDRPVGTPLIGVSFLSRAVF